MKRGIVLISISFNRSTRATFKSRSLAWIPYVASVSLALIPFAPVDRFFGGAIGYELSSLLSPAEAQAEFVQTSPGVLQSSDLTTKVIISHRVPGIFFLVGEPIDLQLFDPSGLESPENEAAFPAVHMFIEYDAAQDRYVALHVGSRAFRIKGGFSLVIPAKHPPKGGNTWQQRITVDNNNPYLSIVHEPAGGSESAQPDILGFRGIQLVVKKTGQRNAALLEANQFNELKGLIEPYTLNSGVLRFKGEDFTGASVGVDIEPAKNSCLQSGTSFLAQNEASGLRKSQDRSVALRELEELLKKGAAKDPFRGALLLRITPQEIIALDYRKNRAMVVRPLPKGAQPVCLIEEVSLDE